MAGSIQQSILPGCTPLLSVQVASCGRDICLYGCVKGAGAAIQGGGGNIVGIDPLAYIPLQRKTIGVGSCRWLRPPMPQFCVGYTNMLVSKNARMCVTPNTKPKICISPNAKPQHKSVEYRLRWVPN